MPVSRRDARTMLEHFEGLASTSLDLRFTRPFGRSALTVEKTPGGGFAYQWGANLVSKSIALSAVETFSEAGR